MDTVLLITYIVLLILQIALLIVSIHRPGKRLWMILLGAETLSAAGAYILMRYYDSLPGTGKAPGLTYFGETLASMGAAITYSVMLGITAAAAVIMYLLKRKHQ